MPQIAPAVGMQKTDDEMAAILSKQMTNGDDPWLTRQQIGTAIRAGIPNNKTEWAKIFGVALAKTMVYLENALPTMQGKDLAIAVGILTDKYLDLTEGRKGSVMVDARTQNLNVLRDVPTEMLMQLAEEVVSESQDLLTGEDNSLNDKALQGEIYDGEFSQPNGDLAHDVGIALTTMEDDDVMIGEGEGNPEAPYMADDIEPDDLIG